MMTKTRVMHETEASDDSISLNSTVASANEDDYEVEFILAERKVKGVMEYLTAWKGYPETEHVWIPRENFNEGEVFDEWTNTQERVANGLERPFDVKAWRKRCKAIQKETDRRKERRRIKRLRLEKRDELASDGKDQNDNVQSSGSDSAPKRSDKRIKRRSVHEDLPPSSSASAPVSSSCSEDSDRPLMSRQESEIFTPNPKWTQAQMIALEEGLRTLKGPRWRELLGLYGRKGKISQVLKDKSTGDLYDKAKTVCQEFVDSGREPPEYLKPFSIDSSKSSRTSTPYIRPESRGQSRAVSKKSSRTTSADSMMPESQKMQRIKQAINQENSRPQQSKTSTEIHDMSGGREKEPNAAKKPSGDEPKSSKVSQAPARQMEAAIANGTHQETTQAVQLIFHPRKAVTNTEAITEVEGSSNNHSHQGGQSSDGPRTKEPSQVGIVPQVGHQPESQAPSAQETAKPATNAAAQPELIHTSVPEGNEAIRAGTARTNWSGTARAPKARPPVSIPSRPEAVGSGPSRPSISKLKPKLGQIEPKKPSTTGDVTAAWNAEPKKRKSNNWATKNADPADGQPKKRSYKLSVQNRIFKSRRDGRPPDPNRLVFIDPKTGKAPTTVPTPSTTGMLSKTPLQLHQEELATKEAEKRHPQEVEDAIAIITSEPDPSSQTFDQNRGIRVDEQEVPDTGRPLSNMSASVLGPATGDMTNGPAQMDTLTSPGPASLNTSPPLEIPLGPRIWKKTLATMSLQDYTKRSMPSAHHSTEAIVSSHRPYSSDDPSRFTLRVHPSREHKNEIFQQPEPNLVIGDIKFGEGDQEGLKVKFVGFGFEVKKLLLTIKSLPRAMDFVFKSVCLASEYKAYFPTEPSDYLGSGSVLPYANSETAVENLVETLANNLQGGLFFAQHYTMLIYPAGASAWRFVDNDLPIVHPGTALRFAIRKPLPPVQADVHALATARLVENEPERYAEIATKLKEHPIQTEDKNINIVFRDMFEIDFGRLVAQNGPQKHPPTSIFFLCFIPQGCEVYEPDSAKRSALRMRTSEEHDLFIKFLQANGAEQIYSMQNISSQEINSHGAWDYFCKNVKSGTIIFHDAYIRYDLVPRLAKHLLHGSVSVWKTSLSPMHPGEKHPHLIRLFPHGGVLLLTESLILYRPREALRVLMWFRRVHVPGKTPGTWKIAVRPRIREWLLDIMDAYSNSGKDIFECSLQMFADIYTEIYWLLLSPEPGVNRLLCHEWDYETPTDEAPIVSSASLRVLQARKEWKGQGADTAPDDDNIRQNDDLLAQWFAEWAIVNLHNFRKYNIILGYTKDDPFTKVAIPAYEKAWGHIEVMTPEEAFARYKVTPQSKLDDMEAERRRKLQQHLPARRAAAKKARKDERQAAKSALEARMQAFKDVGATDEEIMRAGRQLLRDLGGSEKEVRECKVDVDRVFVDRWWEEDPVRDGEVDVEGMDTT